MILRTSVQPIQNTRCAFPAEPERMDGFGRVFPALKRRAILVHPFGVSKWPAALRTNAFRPFAVLFAISFLLNGKAAELKRDIPKATWEPILFVPINELATKAGWKSLRDAPLPSESLEVRIWIGFGLSPLEGYSLRRDGSQWTGRYVVDNARQTNSVSVHDITPKSGWEKTWTKLDGLELLTLPDSSTLHDEAGILDGVCYVVEINHDGHYRTYEYSNPQEQKWPEAKKIVSIVQTLHDQFTKR